ncbi:MAG: glycosyltransferase [Leptolyngbyaceae cyanobacterium SU_3_3]|nr:glycosyltransferase [Leptolyngbyaceae cyanobacterium SU_3_3]NJR50991.1 glycosyltransferase [Leptolyngbyaceae cyanobacterium CSU_1_3]
MTQPSILITIPVFNDWKSLNRLMIQLNETLMFEQLEADVLILNDGSSIAYQEEISLPKLTNIDQVHLVDLKRNLGHQRAIVVGLAYIEERLDHEITVVMDSDGEDSPTDIPKLVNECLNQQGKKIIFARRTQRSETWLFRLFYKIYQSLFKSLTGENIAVGNFSVIPRQLLPRVVILSEIWNHYAAGILKAKLPFATIPCKRGTRLVGRSHMNFVSLVMHGLSAISVYGDVIGIKALLAAILLMLGCVLLITLVVSVRIAVPNWAPYVAGLSFIIFLQCMTVSLAFVFLTLSGRNNFSFLPTRDYQYFILEVKQIFSLNQINQSLNSSTYTDME